MGKKIDGELLAEKYRQDIAGFILNRKKKDTGYVMSVPGGVGSINSAILLKSTCEAMKYVY